MGQPEVRVTTFTSREDTTFSVSIFAKLRWDLLEDGTIMDTSFWSNAEAAASDSHRPLTAEEADQVRDFIFGMFVPPRLQKALWSPEGSPKVYEGTQSDNSWVVSWEEGPESWVYQCYERWAQLSNDGYVPQWMSDRHIRFEPVNHFTMGIFVE